MNSKRANSDESLSIDPIITALLKRLPPAGADWPESERRQWIDALKANLKLVYRDNGESIDPVRQGPEDDVVSDRDLLLGRVKRLRSRRRAHDHDNASAEKNSDSCAEDDLPF